MISEIPSSLGIINDLWMQIFQKYIFQIYFLKYISLGFYATDSSLLKSLHI